MLYVLIAGDETLPVTTANGIYRNPSFGVVIFRDGRLTINGQDVSYAVERDKGGAFVLPEFYVGIVGNDLAIDGTRHPLKLRLDNQEHPRQVELMDDVAGRAFSFVRESGGQPPTKSPNAVFEDTPDARQKPTVRTPQQNVSKPQLLNETKLSGHANIAVVGPMWDCRTMEPASWQFLAIASVCFAVVTLSLWRGATLGIAWRGSFIARRDREPKLFGCSVAIFAAFGLFLIFVVISTR